MLAAVGTDRAHPRNPLPPVPAPHAPEGVAHGAALPHLFVDPEAVKHARNEALAVKGAAKDNVQKVILPPITSGFKASPLDVGEFIFSFVFFSPTSPPPFFHILYYLSLLQYHHHYLPLLLFSPALHVPFSLFPCLLLLLLLPIQCLAHLLPPVCSILSFPIHPSVSFLPCLPVLPFLPSFLPIITPCPFLPYWSAFLMSFSFLVIPPKVDDAFKLFHYIPYSALTHAA